MSGERVPGSGYLGVDTWISGYPGSEHLESEYPDIQVFRYSGIQVFRYSERYVAVPYMASLCCLKSGSPWYDTHLFVFLTLFFNYLVFFCASCPDRGVGGFSFLPPRKRFSFLPPRKRFSFRLPRAGEAPPSGLRRFSGAGRLFPRGRRSMEKSPMGGWWNLGGIGGSKPGVTLRVSHG